MVDISYCSYLRVSTDKQGITGLGMEAQREAVYRYVQNRGQIIAEFIEVESGKKHTNRPQLLAALAECRKRRSVLVIARLDRLARNVAFIANLMNSDVEFVAVDMPHANRLTIHILAAVAEHEREMISQRTKAALAAAKARGKKLGNPNYEQALILARGALGYQPPAAEVLDLMEAWRRSGDTWRRIAERLNGLNNRTPQGFRWYGASARAALLRNRPGTSTSLLKDTGNGSTPSSTAPIAGRRAIEEGGYMPSDIKEAQRMIDLFTSVGARSFVVTKTDVDQAKLWGKSYSVQDLKQKLPAMVRFAAERKPFASEQGKLVSAGENLIVRPTGPETAFIQLDDIGAEQLDRVRPAAFMIIATSPGNHQAWIAVADAPTNGEPFKALMRRVRKAVGGTDKSASHATRVAGTENFKVKYWPDYPIITMTQAVPGRVMTTERLQNMGLLAEPEIAPEPTTRFVHRSTGGHGRSWPDYGRCLAGAPPDKDGSGPDRSKADWCYCLFAARRGFGADEISERLIEVSEKARERVKLRDPGYARVTAQNAVAAVERERMRSRA